MKPPATIEEYLATVGRQRDNAFGQRFRRQFRDRRGTAELAMLAAPTAAEFEGFRRVVEALTPDQKARPETLTDDEVQKVARQAAVEPGDVAIFINGYVLARKAGRDK